ncbi:fructose-bisphosphate aldolase class I [Candidatus Woesebacteria bacterium]|nr:fructose-bisphosphate aldolase class I [Candidatus Woesebacteria bacterium]
MDKKYLVKTAQDLVTDTKGILAADESTGTIKKRFDNIGVESTPENHRRYRQLLFTTPEIEKYIGGVIMFDETIRQYSDDGKHFPELLEERGIMTGIKVDKGKVDFPNFPKEKLTKGLDGLEEKLEEYRELGARFSKWRAVIPVGGGSVARPALTANMKNLAIYAAFAQNAEIVPIVEPEVLIDGDHSVEKCEKVTRNTLEVLFTELYDYKVILEGLILKVNMIVPGRDNPNKLSPKEIAEHTVRVMKDSVSVAVPSVVYLSGGLSPVQSTEYLDAINKLGPHPWELNFSFGRALQEPVLEAWQGKDENIEIAQREFIKRAKLNSLALKGEYRSEMENE